MILNFYTFNNLKNRLPKIIYLQITLKLQITVQKNTKKNHYENYHICTII